MWKPLPRTRRWYQRLSAQHLAEAEVRAPDGTSYLVRVERNAPLARPSQIASEDGGSVTGLVNFVRINADLDGNTGWTITVLDVPRKWRSERIRYTQHVGAKAIVADVTVAITDALARGDTLWDDV